MKIITLHDIEFPQLQQEFKKCRLVGTYWKDDTPREVMISKSYVFVILPHDPERFGVRAAKGVQEAEQFARYYLEREQRRGRKVSYNENFTPSRNEDVG